MVTAIVVVAVCWFVLSVVVGVCIGRACYLRDRIGAPRVRATVHGACQAEREKEAL